MNFRVTGSRSSVPFSILTNAPALSPGGRWIDRIPAGVRGHWPLLAGLALLAVPTIMRLAEQTWSTDAGAHGPIVLATGLWLLSQSWADISRHAKPAKIGVILALLVPILLVYSIGRAFDLLIIEVGGLFAVMMLVVLRLVGLSALWRNLFPFIYLGFLVPIPLWVLEKITMPLQFLVSTAAANFLQWLDYPVAREGVTIFIAQYQLLVEEACSGMNSLTGLIAISLFYVYVMHRASWRYAAILLVSVLPIAIVTNIIRVIILILLTYYKGDAVAQGFLHNTAGILVFAVALALVVVLDTGLQFAVRRRRVRA